MMPCSEWPGQRQHRRGGYGVVYVTGRGMVRAHRWVYEQAHGPIPLGIEIDHICGNTACVELSHLSAVTRAEHARRRSLRQTHCLRGHERTAENTAVRPTGWRYCKACRRKP